ncbi:MAG: ComEC/Rec2 family competence protein [Clostridia bacterium]|nr:ComEC/Rec2 family competence protein [Clostridia bacterium]
MNIFGGRPGVSAGVLAVIATLAAFFFVKAVAFALLAGAAVLLIMLIILCACGYIKPYRLFASAFVIIIFCTALLRGSLFFERKLPIAESFSGDGRYIHATVTERRGAADYFTVFVLRLHSIDGEEYEEKAILNCEYNSGFQVGYEIVLRGAAVTSLAAYPEDEVYDLLSEGIVLSIVSENENDSAVVSKNNFSFADKCRSLNLLCSAKLKNSIKGDGGKLAAAMLLGDKSAIPSYVYRDFSRSGLSHYLAVSGLHVSIITGVVSLILLNLRIKRSYRNLLLALFAIGYLCLLGFPISAVRSVAMLLTVFIAYSLGDSSDALNALGLAAAMLTVINPCVVFDKSFILSFCATLGIVAFMPVFYSLISKLFENKNEDKGAENKQYGKLVLKKSVSFVFGTLMSITAALSLTLLPVMCFFGEVSILSFRSNLTAPFAATPLLAASLFYLIAGRIPYIGELLEWVIDSSAGYMLTLASNLSDTRGALVSLMFKQASVLVLLFSITVFFFLIIKLKHKKPLLVLPALYPLVLAGLVLISVAARPANAEFEILSIGGSETICARHGADAAIVDISEGHLSALRTAYEEAQQKGVTELDTLMLTHYHSKHLSSVSRFIAEVKVRRILLPRPQNESDAWIMAQLAEIASAKKVLVEMIPDDGIELIDGIFVSHSGINRIKRSNSPIFYLSFESGEEGFTYLTESSWESTGALRADLDFAVSDSEYVLIGEQGPIAKSIFDIPLENMKSVTLLGDFGEEYLLHPDSTINEIINESLIEVGVSRKIVVLNE